MTTKKKTTDKKPRKASPARAGRLTTRGAMKIESNITGRILIFQPVGDAWLWRINLANQPAQILGTNSHTSAGAAEQECLRAMHTFKIRLIGHMV